LEVVVGKMYGLPRTNCGGRANREEDRKKMEDGDAAFAGPDPDHGKWVIE
jgi:hypothetical protein